MMHFIIAWRYFRLLSCRRTKRSPYKAGFTNLYYDFFTFTCQTPEQKTVGMKLVSKYIAYCRQPSKALQIQLVCGY